MRPLTLLTLAAAAASLAACNQANSSRNSVAGLCTPFPAAPAATPTSGPVAPAVAPTGDPAAPLDDCLHRWSYALASADDESSAVVAEAALSACHNALTRWNHETLSAGGESSDAPSLTTGESMNPIQAHYAFAQSRALFYAVQAKAGHCAAPRFKDGAPAPATPAS